jgi:hypothetical protein
MKLIPNNKKGIVKIIEAAIAIFMLLGFTTFILISQIQKPNVKESAYQVSHQILREIADNYTLRDSILKNDISSTKTYVEKRLIEFPFKFSIARCLPEESCLCPGTICPSNVEIYADDIIISTNLSDYSPKKLALFMWVPAG